MPQAFGFVAGLVGFGAAPAFGAAAFGGWAAGAAFGSTVVGGLVGKLLTSVAASALMSALGPKPPQGGGITISTTLRGEQNPETIILGWTATAGQAICPPYSHGKSNAYLTHVIELCSAPGATLSRLILNDDYVELGSTPHPDYGLPVLGEDYEGLVWVKYYDGRQTAADPMLRAQYGNHPDRPWTADMVGAGLCYAILTFKFHKSDLTQVPRYRFELDGIPLYDLRRDSTAGGSGPQRWSDPSTWTQTRNPGVIAWNIKRGITLPGGAVWGGHIEAADLPRAGWTSAMNICDSAVTLPGGATEARYRCGLEVALTTEPAASLEELLKACSGAVADMGGVWDILVGAPALPVYSFSDEDVLVSKTQELDPFPSLSETYNGVSAQYPDPDSLWESKEAPPRYNEDWEAQDVFGRKVADLALPAVPFKRQVQRLMRAWIKDERRFRRHMFSLPPDAAMVGLLDTLDYSSARNGYVGKDFTVSEIVEDLRTCIQQVSIRERDPADYDWQPEFELPSTPTTPGSTLPIPETVAGFAVQPLILTDAAGQPRRVALRLSWDADLIAQGLRWQVRLAGQTAAVLRGGVPEIDEGEITLTDGILPATAYQIRARLIAARRTAWTGWIGASTAPLRLGPADLDWSELETDILDAVADLEAWIGDEVDALSDALLAETQARVSDIAAQATALAAQADALVAETQARATALAAEAQARVAAVTALANDLAGTADTLAAESAARAQDAMLTASRFRAMVRSVEGLRDYVAELDYQGFTAREDLRRQIGAVVEGYAASFDERITTAASASGAVAERVTTLEAVSTGLSAQILTVDTARVTGETALAQQIAAVSVGTNTQFDHAAIWYFDSTAEGWTGAPAAPSVVAQGWLRPASGAGSSIVSPAAQDVDAARYAQLRLRLRQVGSPAWTGHLWWAAPAQGFDPLRRITMPAPTWVEGIALITVTPDWAGQIDRLRLDLATAPDAANYIEVDWVALGRPSPGASSAELVAERTARLAADSAQATALEALEASVTDLTSGQTATVSALSALDGRVSTTEGSITAIGTAVTALQSDVAGKASASAVTQLETEVVRLTDAVTTASQSATALRSTLLPLASEVLDQGFADFLAAMGVRAALAAAEESLTTRIEATDAGLALTSAAVTRLETSLPGLASASALDSLTTRVSTTEAAVTAQATALTSLQAELTGKASASALNSLTTRVTAAEGVNSAQGSAITSLQADLTGKASVAALTALTTRVSDAEGALSSQASAITSLQADLGSKASASALSSLATRVTEAEGVNSAQGTAITSLQNDLTGKASASALNALTTRVSDAEGALSSQASAITTLQADLGTKASATALSSLTTRVTATEGVNASQGTAITSLQNDLTGKASVAAVNALTTRVSDAEGALASQADAITTLQAGLGTKASATALSTLSTRVTAVEGVNTAQGTAITSLQNDLTGKANVTALTALTTRVSDAEGALASQADSITTLQAGLGTKASASALSSLTTRVTAAEGVNTAQGTAITSLQNDLGGKANVSALTALTTRVTGAETSITAMAGSLTALTASVGRFEAQGLLRVTVEATPEGALSRIGLKAAAGSDEGNFREAALYLEARAGGTSRVLIKSDQFAILNGDARETVFIASEGAIYIRKALIKEADIDMLKIAGNAVTTVEYNSAASAITVDATEVDIIAVSIDRTAGFRTRIGFSCTFNSPRSSGTQSRAEMRLYRGSSLIHSWLIFADANAEQIGEAKAYFYADPNTGGGATTYTIRAVQTQANRDGVIRRPNIEAQQFKR
ncbi:hypothetical protein Q9299_05120 [Gemmobacter fulvus]|uniref:hypothetical protein n=1 Tax=Gemmobacter fulvus TaxID=2840474 RepID=UPI002796748D|nr:hypothetical protein [Gemmobacter fulvus]MDQ1847663.1 hypothetical protein [Gemmobacter fulvus]